MATEHEQPTRVQPRRPSISGGQSTDSRTFDAPVPQLCPSCAAALADDQRWCLNCGRRLGDGRADLRAALDPAPPRAVAPAPVVAPAAYGPLLRSPLGGGALAAALLFGLVFGAIALGGGDEAPPPDVTVNVPRQEAPRVNVSVPAGGAAVPADIASDWPGDDGWTVQVATLPKEGTTQAQVDQARSDAEGKGADDVGVVDPDDYPSLDPGDYVLYSGVFKTKKAARKELRGLRKDFPDAKVVKVAASGGAAPKLEKDAKKASDAELKDIEKASGDDFVKKSKKLPEKVGTAGKAPPKDDKPAGGGEDQDEGAVIE